MDGRMDGWMKEVGQKDRWMMEGRKEGWTVGRMRWDGMG